MLSRLMSEILHSRTHNPEPVAHPAESQNQPKAIQKELKKVDFQTEHFIQFNGQSNLKE